MENKYDDAVWNIFKIIVFITLIYIGANLNIRYKKSIIKEAIKEIENESRK